MGRSTSSGEESCDEKDNPEGESAWLIKAGGRRVDGVAGRDTDAESPRNAVEMFAANDISATDAVRTTEEGVEAIVASGVVSRISRVGEGVELFDLTRLNVRFDGL